MIRNALMPFGVLYGSATAVRNWLYDNNIYKTEGIGKPVISIGNLTVGGTGKTPLAMAIAELILAQGKKPAIVSRGYGGELIGVEQVDIDHHSASSHFGDEPVLMAIRLRNVPVVVGADRVAAAIQAARSSDVVIADDAFQHRRLRRNLDIVVIDASQKLSTLLSLPWGNARESWSGLSRANLVVLSKVNLADGNLVERWRRKLAKLPNLPVVEAVYIADGLSDINGQPWIKPMKSWMAVSGIGQPKPFQRLLIDEMKLSVTKHHWYRDHYAFTEQDIEELAKELSPNMGIVITEKDAVKWRRSRHPVLDRVAVARVKVGWPKGKEALDRALAALPI